MLNKVSIKWFKSCKNVVLDNLGPMTVLTGRNGVGKTNVLKAIEWAARGATSSGPLSMPRIDQPNAISLEFDIDLDATKFLYNFTARARTSQDHTQGDPKSAVTLSETLGVQEAGQSRSLLGRIGTRVAIPDRPALNTQEGVSSLVAMRALLPPDDPFLGQINPLFDFLSKIRYYPFDGPNELPFHYQLSAIWENTYKFWLSQSGSHLAFESPVYDGTPDTLLKILHLYLNDKRVFDELNSLIGPGGLNLIDGIGVIEIDHPIPHQGQESQKIYFIRFPSKIRGGPPGARLSEFGELSLGTRRILDILVALLFDKSTVILGEHPEDGIHPGLTRKLIGLLRQYASPGQMILTSHSIEVFDELDPGDLRLVTMDDGETILRTLDPGKVAAARKFVSENGPLSDYLESIQED